MIRFVLNFCLPDARTPWPQGTDENGQDLALYSKDVRSYLQFKMFSPELSIPFHPMPGEYVTLDVQNTWRNWSSGTPLERENHFVVVHSGYAPSGLSNHYGLEITLEGDALMWDGGWFPEDTASKLLAFIRDLRAAEWTFATEDQRMMVDEYVKWWDTEFKTLEALADGGFWQVESIDDICEFDEVGEDS